MPAQGPHCQQVGGGLGAGGEHGVGFKVGKFRHHLFRHMKYGVVVNGQDGFPHLQQPDAGKYAAVPGRADGLVQGVGAGQSFLKGHGVDDDQGGHIGGFGAGVGAENPGHPRQGSRRLAEAGTGPAGAFVEQGHGGLQVAGGGSGARHRRAEFGHVAGQFGAGRAVGAPFLPLQGSGGQSGVEMLLGRGADAFGHDYGKGGLYAAPVDFHTQPGKGVGGHGRRRGNFNLQDGRPAGPARQDVGAPARVEGFGAGVQPDPFPEQPGQRVVDDAFVAAVVVGCYNHKRTAQRVAARPIIR